MLKFLPPNAHGFLLCTFLFFCPSSPKLGGFSTKIRLKVFSSLSPPSVATPSMSWKKDFLQPHLPLVSSVSPPALSVFVSLLPPILPPN